MNGSSAKTLGVADFEYALGESLTDYVADRIRKYSFQYCDFSSAEKEALLIKIIDALLDPALPRSGEHRLEQWERGWGENLESFVKNPASVDLLTPRYFAKYGAIRWCGDFINPISTEFEGHSLAVLLDWLFDKYLRGASDIYEFGCGTGHNLLRVRGVNSSANLWGLDWAQSSQKIIEKLASYNNDSRLRAARFDYFNPDSTFKLARESVVYTVASLEQVGNRWESFVDYLRKNKPSICIHIEPIEELLDEQKLMDNLAIRYFRKRNYLDGFLTGLRRIEAEGGLKIHRAQRTNIGSLFIEGYSVVVWSPT